MTFLMLWNSPGGPQLVPSKVSTVWTEETLAGDTPGRECPHDYVGIRPRMGTMRMLEDQVPSLNIESPYGGGVSSLPGATGSFLPVKCPAAPVLLADGPQLGFWLVTMLLFGCCPHLTVTLLAQLARMSQGALLAQMIVYMFWNRSSISFWTMHRLPMAELVGCGTPCLL